MTGLILKAQCICDVCMRRIEFQMWIYERRITGILMSKFSVNISYTSSKEELRYSYPRNWIVHQYTNCLPTASSHTHHRHLYAIRSNTLSHPDLIHPDLKTPHDYMSWPWVRGVCASCISEQAMYWCTIRSRECEHPINVSTLFSLLTPSELTLL